VTDGYDVGQALAEHIDAKGLEVLIE